MKQVYYRAIVDNSKCFQGFIFAESRFKLKIKEQFLTKNYNLKCYGIAFKNKMPKIAEV